MPKYTTTAEELTSIANAIRAKTGGSSELVFPIGFVSAINSISSSGTDTSDANATASDILYNKTAYVNGSKITGNIQTKTSSDLIASGLTVTAPAGYYSAAATKTLTDANLIASNIKNGTNIFGVTGTYVTPNNYPTFTVVSNNNSTTVTCDKTYSECLAYVYDGVMMADIVFEGIHLPFTCINEPTNNTIIYSTTAVNDEQGINTLRIIYASSGIITYDEIYVDKQDSSTLTASGATVTAPAGYYPAAATKTIASGTEGTPTATKGVVSNHQVSITPSVTNTSGYISGGTHSGTAVSVSASELVSGTKSIGANGTGIDITNYASVDVSVSPSLQAKTNISPTESSQTISADSGYDGLSSVQINAISSTYVGSGITSRSSSDLTVSGATVTVPAGYYSSQASKAVANGSAAGPATISGTSATVSTGTNTLTLTKTVSVIPTVSAGYVSSGSVTNSSVSLTASVTTKAAATITPGTTNQTIASGTYLTGTQTISGDSNLVASNIISGKSIFGVSGSVVIQHYYTGSSTPSSSTGVNGDIYLKTS